MPSLELIDGRCFVRLVTAEHDACIEEALRGRVAGLMVNPHAGFTGRTLEFLRDLPALPGLFLTDGHGFDLSPLQALTQLRILWGVDATPRLNLGCYPLLESLRIGWHPGLVLPTFDQLEELGIDRFRTTQRDFRALPPLPRLRHLELAQGNTISLRGIDRFPRLRRFEGYYLRYLEDVAPLSLTSLEFLQLDHCPRVANLESVRCATLRQLRYNRSAPLLSLGFLAGLPRLREFRFVNTNVIDGNLTPCLRLEAVAFSRKRHFSHTPGAFSSRLPDGGA